MSKILVIEDNSNMQSLLCEFIEAFGYQTECACNGKAGLEAVRQSNPDLVLTDVNMPGMDGYALLEVLREDVNTATIPVIFLTAAPNVPLQLKSKQLNVDDCLSKPVNYTKLIHSIQQQLARPINNRQQSPVINKSEIAACSLS